VESSLLFIVWWNGLDCVSVVRGVYSRAVTASAAVGGELRLSV
jgi:hypothetical protein